jgi:hypothetical protein
MLDGRPQCRTNEEGQFVVTEEESEALSDLAERQGYYGAVYWFTATVPAAGPRNFRIEIPEEPNEEAVELKAEEVKAA